MFAILFTFIFLLTQITILVIQLASFNIIFTRPSKEFDLKFVVVLVSLQNFGRFKIDI